MVLRLYGKPTSSNVRRAAVVCKELGILYEFVPIDPSKREQKTPEYLEKHPFGQYPLIDDDGTIVYDSRAICRYLAVKAQSPLLPSSSALSVARFEQAAANEAFNFDPFANEIGQVWAASKKSGSPIDKEKVETLAAGLEEKLRGYERILSKQHYLAGDEITLADLFHLPTGARLSLAGVDLLEDKEKFPNVSRWWTEISSRSAWQEVKNSAI